MKLEALIIDGIEVSKLAGQAIFGLGMNIAQIATGPKIAAASLLGTADKFEIVAEHARTLAEKICDWDANRLITHIHKPLVGTNGKPITSH